jgi:hypothetical protein
MDNDQRLHIKTKHHYIKYSRIINSVKRNTSTIYVCNCFKPPIQFQKENMMKAKNLITGRLENMPTPTDIKKAKRKKLADKRKQKKLEQAEQREQQKIQVKNNRRKSRDKFNSSPGLQKSASKLLKEVMSERNIQYEGNKVFDAVVNAKLGKQFSRETRADKHKILAVGCCIFHELAAQKNPKEALYRLAESAGVELNKINDPSRIIMECLVDYGSKGRYDDRQFVARDARALSWVIREKMTPQEVMNPKDGEHPTLWAKKEAAYRSHQKSQDKAPWIHARSATRWSSWVKTSSGVL